MVSGLFDHLRADALKHLKDAERLVIIGYSMPKTDLHIKYLMTHALDTPDRPAIEIWDIEPYAKMQERIENMFGKTLARDVEYHPQDGKLDAPRGLDGFVRSHTYGQKRGSDS